MGAEYPTATVTINRRLGLTVLGLLAAGSLVARAQTPNAAPAVPVDQEPQHKLVFKNEFVRIIDATLPPGYVTLNHTHAADSVAVTISNGREGEAALRGLGRAGFSRGGYSHVVTNGGHGVMRYIVVEPVRTDRPNATPASLPGHTLETENDRVRIYRVKLAAGESMEPHTHLAGRVEVTVTGPGGPGSRSWISGGENHPLKVPAGGTALDLVELEPK
jgi:hypothetical protein